MNNIYWLPDEEFQKALTQLRLQLGEIMSVFHLYGMGALIPGALEEQIEVAIDFSKRCRGEKNQPIRVKNRRNPRL